jgi:methionyl-tRNA formyltransferase
LRVVFMGTPEFAVPSLRALAEVTEVVGVLSRADSISGRGRTVRPSPVKAAAEQLGLQVFQPTTLRDGAAAQVLAHLEPDLLVVAAYGLILPRAILESSRLGAVNVHASLLPRWRGAAPIQRAILAGDAETGVTIMRMEEGLDTGPYCLKVPTPIGDASAAELTDRLARIGADALVQALPAIADNSVDWIAQDEALATYAEKITKADVSIAPEQSALQALLHIRASLAAAPCRISVAGRGVTLVAARAIAPLAAGALTPGAVARTKDGLLLGMNDGALLVQRLKPDGKGEMAAADWSRGIRDIDGASWDGVR